jgi:pSer/pThr/pTyr-binding forkhead associated (FHA) protein
MQKIVIRHLSGARANQVDEFPDANAQELIVGRDGAAGIRFDADRDDLVSRQHSKIVRDPADPSAFQLVDLQSRNGTFLNRQRVYGAVRLSHDDVVQLGAGGPEFRFEMVPPPVVSAPRATREASPEMLASLGVKSTRESWLPSPGQPGVPRPVGRATVERMLGDVFTRVKRESNRSLWVGVLALIAILAVGSVIWLYMRQSQILQAAAQEQNMAKLQSFNEELKKNPEASNEMKEQIAKLEAQLKQSDKRNEDTIKALLKEVKIRMEQANTERMKAVIAQRQLAAQQAARTPAAEPTPLPTPVAPPPAPQPAQTATPLSAQTYDSLMEQASEQYKHGQAKIALGLVELAIAKDGSRWESYGFAGQLAGVLNDYTLASAMLTKAIQLAPEDNRQDLQAKLEDVKQKTSKN